MAVKSRERKRSPQAALLTKALKYARSMKKPERKSLIDLKIRAAFDFKAGYVACFNELQAAYARDTKGSTGADHRAHLAAHVLTKFIQSNEGIS